MIKLISDYYNEEYQEVNEITDLGDVIVVLESVKDKYNVNYIETDKELFKVNYDGNDTYMILERNEI